MSFVSSSVGCAGAIQFFYFLDCYHGRLNQIKSLQLTFDSDDFTIHDDYLWSLLLADLSEDGAPESLTFLRLTFTGEKVFTATYGTDPRYGPMIKALLELPPIAVVEITGNIDPSLRQLLLVHFAGNRIPQAVPTRRSAHGPGDSASNERSQGSGISSARAQESSVSVEHDHNRTPAQPAHGPATSPPLRAGIEDSDNTGNVRDVVATRHPHMLSADLQDRVLIADNEQREPIPQGTGLLPPSVPDHPDRSDDSDWDSDDSDWSVSTSVIHDMIQRVCKKFDEPGDHEPARASASNEDAAIKNAAKEDTASGGAAVAKDAEVRARMARLVTIFAQENGHDGLAGPNVKDRGRQFYVANQDPADNSVASGVVASEGVVNEAVANKAVAKKGNTHARYRTPAPLWNDFMHREKLAMEKLLDKSQAGLTTSEDVAKDDTAEHDATDDETIDDAASYETMSYNPTDDESNSDSNASD